MSRLSLDWTVGHHSDPATPPTRLVPATVPGAVQLDWAAAEGWAPYWLHENHKQYRWMEDTFWTYQATLPTLPARPAGDRIFLILNGVDYAFSILLDDQVLHRQEGMFTPVRLDITDRYQPGRLLKLCISPAPKSQKEPENRDQANHSCKPAVSYEWDFHPRLIPLGIWQDAYLESTSGPTLTDLELRYILSDDLSTATLTVSADSIGPAASAQLQLLDPAGQIALQSQLPLPGGRQTITLQLNNPTLWWPHDQGTPALYTLRATLNQSTIEKRVGFRRTRLVIHEGGWKYPDRFPKGPSNPPITLEINGRPIFAKGSNWVSPDIFPGRLTADFYRQLLTLARNSNMNILRMWGGAPAQKEAFYQIADELGLMIWQEFPLSCNCYPDDPAYLQTLDQESRSLITRLRQHPSVVLFCGGNELFNSWSRMTEQSHALRLLDRNCFDLAPDRPFLKTSPIMGMGHGHYCFRDMKHEEDAWAIFQRSACTAYTEFGVGGASPIEVLRKCKSAEKLELLLKPGMNSKDFGEQLHQPAGLIEHFFGPQTSLEEWVRLSHWLQGEGYRGLFEESRRQKPRAAMAINWCFNEPWPNAANLSLIAWPCEPKGSLEQVAAALRPTLASARMSRFSWTEGDLFEAELWLLSDSPTDHGTLQVTASIEAAGQHYDLLTWPCPPAPANTNTQGPRIQFRLPAINAPEFHLSLQIASAPHLNSTYRLHFRPKQK